MKYIYKAVSAILAIATIPATIFLEFFFIQASTSIIDVGVKESFSLSRLYDIFIKKTDPFSIFFQKAGYFSWPEEFEPLTPWLIASAVCLVLTLVAAIFICVWSICSNKRIVNIIVSGAGILSAVLMTVFFSKASSFITLGTVDYVKALGGKGIVGSIIGSVISIDTFALGGFKNAIIILFALIIVWTLAFILIDLGDEKEEKKTK